MVNEKLYIGITKLSLAERWAKHLKDSINPKYPLHCAIKKYGVSNFKIDLLEESNKKEYISSLEEPTIQKFNSRSHGYNVALGGYGGDLGPEANNKRKLTIANRSNEDKKKLSDLQRKRQCGKTKYNDAGRLSQSIKVTGNQFALGSIHSEETKKKISNSSIGKIVTDITRQRMSESAIINNNGTRFAGRRVSCLCCLKEWDIGNYTQHIRKNYEL